MDLREYLFRKRMKVTAFADKIGYQRTYLSSISTGLKVPGRKLAQAIKEATEGQVDYEALQKQGKQEQL